MEYYKDRGFAHI